MRGHRVVRRALEDVEVLRLLGDDRDRLDGRRAGADDPDPPTAEVDRIVRPLSGVVARSGERFQPFDARRVGDRKAARRHDAVSSQNPFAGADSKRPARGRLLPGRGEHPGAEPDVAPQIEPVRDVVRVAQDLRLSGVALGPLPLLLQCGVELERVLHALDVAAGAGIPVPVPGASHAVRPFVHAGSEPQSAQPVQHVEPGEACADDGHVDAVVTSGVPESGIRQFHECSAASTNRLNAAHGQSDESKVTHTLDSDGPGCRGEHTGLHRRRRTVQ